MNTEENKTIWLKCCKYWKKSIPVVCVIICIGCLCVAFVKKSPMSFDLMSALVGVLSTLVTVLAVFLAINYFVFENRIKEYVRIVVGDIERKVDSEAGSIKAEIESQINDIDHSVKAHFFYADSGDFYVHSRHGRLIGCLNGLKEEETSKRKYALNSIMEKFVSLIPNLNENEKYLPANTKKDYLNAIKFIDHPDIDTIYDFVYTLREEGDAGDIEKKDED